MRFGPKVPKSNPLCLTNHNRLMRDFLQLSRLNRNYRDTWMGQVLSRRQLQ